MPIVGRVFPISETSERADITAFAEMCRVIWLTETQDFGGYSQRDAESVAQKLWEAGYRKAEGGRG